MTAPVSVIAFAPRLTSAEARSLLRFYDPLDDKAALEAGRLIRGGDFSPDHLRTIFEWKTRGRGRSRLARNTEEEIRDTLRLAMAAKTSRASMAVLVGLAGVDVPVASSVLALARPDEHTVIDFRALEALGYSGKDRTIGFYLRYLAYCSTLAAAWQMSLRDLDRSLWQWSKRRSEREGS